MAQEIERAGIPTVIITSLDTVARSMGCWRIVRGAGVMHVTGDPSLTPAEEVRWRRRLLERALQSLEDRVTEPTVYLVDPAKEAV